ncbi:VWA domain-containing protein [Candidatus Woesearchaeota archaeon]|jgi:hypothetical protein|nr:VWA domain-containing protein [Candidatus Woesearchaeota archaeon]MBT6044471.1 VWA domain-containing protein [Candidatus Woesearchaeota archaeon]
MFDFLLNYFVSPAYLLLLFLLIIITVILFSSNKTVGLTRFFIGLLLILSLAQPYSPVNLFGGGSSGLGILEDNSSSYNVFGPSVGQINYNLLKSKGSVDYSNFGSELVSDVGDAVIESMMDGKNVLLLSDGNINFGEELSKVKEFAVIENLSISTIKRDVVEEDYSVSIIGPDKIGPNTEATFTVQVSGTSGRERMVELEVDGNVVLTGDAGELEYVAKFGDGYHRMTAKLLDDDFFNENNIYHKSVKVVEKPKILLYGDVGTPLHRSLSKLYTVDVGTPFNLDRYHTVIVDDKDASSLAERVGDLEDYVEDGNGLVVVGGRNSFDHGMYSGSGIEDLLPVKVSGTEKKEGNVNVIILIDISTSTSSSYGTSTAADVAKGLAISTVDNIADENNLGVVAFNTEGITVEDLGLLGDKDRDKIKGVISSLNSVGATNVGAGIYHSVELLKKESGGKNIILISDGQTQGDWRAAREVAINEGIKIYSVAVGTDANEDLLKGIACVPEANCKIGENPYVGGEFYLGTQSHQLSFVFGDPEGSTGSSSNTKIYGAKHFITEGLILGAEVFGTNQVLPKSSAQLLITTGDGEPVLTVWRRGLGRVAVLSTDNGNSWGGGLYKGVDSRVISRTVNWAAGDPERKKDYFFSIYNPRVKEEAEMVIRGNDIPAIEDVKFSRKSDGTYIATIMPSNVGFFTFGDDEYSVNYNSEYSNVGWNNELEELVRTSGGHVFESTEDILDVLEFLKEKKNITLVEKELFIWPLLSLAMIIFILDVWFRTVSERKNI